MNDARRLFLLSALTGLAGTASLAFAPALASALLPTGSAADALRAVAAAQPALSYHTAGPESGRPIVLVRAQGEPVDRYAETASLLAAQGFKVLLPALRDAEPATLGQDLIGFLDSLHIPEAVFIGNARGANAARAAANVRRSRIVGLVLADGSATPAAASAAAVPPTIRLSANATPQEIADATATLVRQGKWRT